MMLLKMIDRVCTSKLIKYLEYLAFISLAYILFFRPYLTSDYCPLVNEDWSEVYSRPDFIALASSGRGASYVMYVPLFLFSKIGITYFHNAWIMQAIGMLIYALCAVFVYAMLARVLGVHNIDLRKDILLDACIMLMFINPFITETYVYGSMHWAVGVLAACLGAYYWTKTNYIKGFLCGAFSVSFYQSDILIMLILCLTVYVLEGIEEKKLTKIFKKCVLISVICVSECLLNVLLQKLFIFSFSVSNANKNISINAAGSLRENVHSLLEYVDIFMKLSYGFAPYCYTLMLFIFCFILGAILILMVLRLNIFDVCIWSIYCLCMAFVPYSFGIVEGAGGYPPRVVFSIFFSIAGMILCISRLCSNAENKLIYKYLNTLFVVLSTGVYIVYTELGIADCFIQQALDRHEVIAIENEIEVYEEETGISVNRILSKTDSNPLFSYPDQLLNYWGYTYNRRILIDAWSQGYYLNYVCGTEYDCGNMSDEQYKLYFDDAQWDSFNVSQQLHFEGDTLFWAVY